MNSKTESCLVFISDDDDIEPETIPICEREPTPEKRSTCSKKSPELQSISSEDRSPSPSSISNKKSGSSPKQDSKKRPRISFPSPEKDKDVYSAKRSRKSESFYRKRSTYGITPDGLPCHVIPSDLDLKFDESLEDEIPAGSGFYQVPISDSEDDVIDDLDEEISKKTRLSFIGRYFEAGPKFENPKILTGKNGIYFTPFFTKKYVFSNHFPCKFTAHGQVFNCSEQYYMYQKARYFGDRKRAMEILECTDPRDMKLIGREIAGFDRDEWDKVSLKVMKSACLFKFKSNKDIRYALFETAGSILIEASKQDKLWGVGLDMLDKDLLDPDKWPGKNQLGYLLTKLRDYLMELPEYRSELDQLNQNRQHDD